MVHSALQNTHTHADTHYKGAYNILHYLQTTGYFRTHRLAVKSIRKQVSAAG